MKLNLKKLKLNHKKTNHVKNIELINRIQDILDRYYEMIIEEWEYNPKKGSIRIEVLDTERNKKHCVIFEKVSFFQYNQDKTGKFNEEIGKYQTIEDFIVDQDEVVYDFKDYFYNYNSQYNIVLETMDSIGIWRAELLNIDGNTYNLNLVNNE